MKKLYTSILWLTLVMPAAFAQQKMFDLNLVRKFVTAGESSDAYSITGAFNKTKGPTADAVFLHTGTFNGNNGKTYVFGIRPAFDVNLGSDTKSSPNNVTSSVIFSIMPLVLPNQAHVSFFGEFTPTFVTDKDFKTGLLYTSFTYGGYKYLSKQRAKTLHTHTLLAALSYHAGNRFGNVTEGVDIKGFFHRGVPNLYWEYNIFNRSRQLNLINFKVDSKYYFIWGDGLFNKDKKLPNLTSTISYTLPINRAATAFGKPEVRFNVKYNYGYEEPNFQKLSVLTVGLGVYAKL